MELKQAFERITHFNEKLPTEAVDVIRTNKDEAIPLLLDYINELSKLESVDEVTEDFHYPDFVLLLLAEFRVKEAFPNFLKLICKDEELIDGTVGDLLCENYGSMLASVAIVDDIPQIITLCKDTSVSVYHRSAAVDSLVVLYAEGITTHAQTSEYLGEILKESTTDDEFNAFTVCECEAIHAVELYEHIKTMFDDGLIDTHVVGKEFFEKVTRLKTVESCLEELRNDDRKMFITDAIKTVKHWYCYQEKPKHKPDFGRKIGSNEPCPCGSGKKYKKCCALV